MRLSFLTLFVLLLPLVPAADASDVPLPLGQEYFLADGNRHQVTVGSIGSTAPNVAHAAQVRTFVIPPDISGTLELTIAGGNGGGAVAYEEDGTGGDAEAQGGPASAVTVELHVGLGTFIPCGSTIKFVLGRVGGVGYDVLSCGPAGLCGSVHLGGGGGGGSGAVLTLPTGTVRTIAVAGGGGGASAGYDATTFGRFADEGLPGSLTEDGVDADAGLLGTDVLGGVAGMGGETAGANQGCGGGGILSTGEVTYSGVSGDAHCPWAVGGQAHHALTSAGGTFCNYGEPDGTFGAGGSGFGGGGAGGYGGGGGGGYSGGAGGRHKYPGGGGGSWWYSSQAAAFSGSVATKSSTKPRFGYVEYALTVEREIVPPVITCPGDQTFECEAPGGTAVNFALASATDTFDPNPTITYTHAPNSFLFPGGDTLVTAVAMDASGNISRCTFTVTLTDTTPPSIDSLPDDIGPIVCVLPGGGVVNYAAATASDNCDASPAITYSHASGSTFPIGVTTVAVTATDDAGLSASETFTVTLIPDTTKPTFDSVPTDIGPLECNQAGGRIVTYDAASASDDCDVSPDLAYSHASGSVFPLGTTTVTVTATDDSGNVATGTFTITIEDTTSPTLTCSLSRTMLWPARGGLLPLGFSALATDVCGTPEIDIQVYSNEAEGTGPLGPDASSAATAASLRLRAERAYPGVAGSYGRIYLVVVRATDPSGNATVHCKSVIVPKLPYGSYIVGLRAAAAAAEAQTLSAGGSPPAGFASSIHGLTLAP